MPSLKTLKVRIKSIKSTQKITKAMKMVAASKLKRAREQAETAVPYVDKMEAIVKNLASAVKQSGNSQSPLLVGTGKDLVYLVIVITSDRGLCGAFNLSIIKAARKKVEQLEANGKKVKLVCIGKKGYDLLRPQYHTKIVKHYDNFAKKGVKFTEAQQIAEYILEAFEKEEFDHCHVLYNKFKSVISQVVTSQQLIPLHIDSDIQEATSYECEPSEEEILKDILPKNLAVQIYRALIESYASEQGARMSAMDNATRNSGEMIKKLSLVYNRTRQAYITKELIEIISGADAI